MIDQVVAAVGRWYLDRDGQLFEVVALDEADGTVEIQYSGGELGELDAETWHELVLDVAEQPEDWAVAFDEVQKDDLGYSDLSAQPEDWAGPLETIEPVD